MGVIISCNTASGEYNCARAHPIGVVETRPPNIAIEIYSWSALVKSVAKLAFLHAPTTVESLDR